MLLSADLRSLLSPETAESLGENAPQAVAVEYDPNLMRLLEQAIRRSGLHERAHEEPDAEAAPTEAFTPADVLSSPLDRLIEELTKAQGDGIVMAALDGGVQQDEAAAAELQEPRPFPFDFLSLQPAFSPEPEPASLPAPDSAPSLKTDEAPVAEEISRAPVLAAWTAALGSPDTLAPPAERPAADETLAPKATEVLRQRARKLVQALHPCAWNRRRLALLSSIHRHVFDRRSEQLLFYKTPSLDAVQVSETDEGPQKTFFYQGPIPKLLLDWALSALPRDLTSYAFVDFRAGHGRTLLLAARHNFEYAAGYAFDAHSAERLEMNLAHYPRTALTCCDVRALRGDRDGVIIPSQAAVLFFPDSLSLGHLDIILTNAVSSLRRDQPLYLIFENAGREEESEQLKLFEKAPLPFYNRLLASFFAPGKIAVYRARPT